MTLASAAVLTGLSASASAVDFEPFTEVEDVCPECEKPAADEVTFSDGETVRGEIVAENDDFYVMVRYGEARAIPHDMVEDIEWAEGGRPSGLNNRDQIVLRSGHVLSGTIIEEKNKPPVFRLESSFADYTYNISKDQVETAYKRGSQYDFEIPQDDEN